MKLERLAIVAFFIAVLSSFSMTALAQLPPGASLIPAGFKLTGERNQGGAAIFIEAKKPNENFPRPHTDHGIDLEISWTKHAMPSQALEMFLKMPEEPAKQDPGSATRTEPCGKQSYRGGVLTCRKVITPWIGAGSGPELVTYRIGWGGKTSNALLGISVNYFYGSKQTAMAWIDSIITKMTTK